MKDLFEKQRRFQNRLKNDMNSIEYLRTQSLALFVELGELLNETPWKPWKKSGRLNLEKAREELVDCWHFLINISLIFFEDFESLKKEFMRKHEVNNDRQKKNY